MILIFGGTTEGKKVAELFDIIGQEYFYSTKTDAHKNIKGKRLYGGMDADEMYSFCSENSIRLIVDAAHPFAVNLHANIFHVSSELQIEVIRYERKFPERQSNNLLHYFDSYEDLTNALLQQNHKTILALTGVQTIAKFKAIWEIRNCYFRILDTELSKEKAMQTGIPEKYVISMQPEANAKELVRLALDLNAEVLLSKESGESGFFDTKVEVAKQLNIPLWIVKRPVLPNFKNVANNAKTFLQLFYRKKRTILKTEGELQSGFTTGTCVTAAAKACFLALTEKEFPSWVEVELPGGENTRFAIFPEDLGDKSASCVVIKDAGDDPDVTHAKEIGCELSFSEQQGICFLKGKGIGEVTLPGLQVAVGKPAINPVPQKMVSDMLTQMADKYELECGFNVKPFVPEGEELAKQTFNPRIGVVGGISIIGTSGKVMPYSNEAFLASIKQQVKVAKENGCREIVLTSGKRSENRLKERFHNLPSLAFIHFGNLVGDTIKLAVDEGIEKINLAIMFGKAVKLAEGHLDTHSKNVVFNPEFLAGLVEESSYPRSIVREVKEMTLANALIESIPFGEEEPIYQEIAERCYQNCSLLLPKDCKLTFFLLVGDTGVIKKQKLNP